MSIKLALFFVTVVITYTNPNPPIIDSTPVWRKGGQPTAFEARSAKNKGLDPEWSRISKIVAHSRIAKRYP